MDGVLLIDKPIGVTSHDVVAQVRRLLGERAIGHTGTLDPLASGLLPLVVGRATRLAALLSGHDKTYDATVRLGFRTSTDDAEGVREGGPFQAVPPGHVVRAALETFLGASDQYPPAHSAKKIGGRKAYALARAGRLVPLMPVRVTVHEIAYGGVAADLVSFRVRAGAGFYVRALARDLGDRLGCGGHVAALRRVAIGPFGEADAIPLAEAAALPRPALGARLLDMASALPDLPAVHVDGPALVRVRHGNWIGPAHGAAAPPTRTGDSGPIKVLAADGRLVAIAEFRGGALHPVTVLG